MNNEDQDEELRAFLEKDMEIKRDHVEKNSMVCLTLFSRNSTILENVITSVSAMLSVKVSLLSNQHLPQ